MSDRAAEWTAAIEAARTADEVCAAVARALWHNARDGAECPAHRRPTEAQLALALRDLPGTALTEAAALLGKLPLGVPREKRYRWDWRRAPSETGRAELMAWGSPDAEYGFHLPLRAAHSIWLEIPTPRPRHPVAPLIAAWQRVTPVPVAAETRHGALLPDSWRDARYHDHLPLQTRPYPEPPGVMAGDQHLLPLAELDPAQSVVVPVLPWPSTIPVTDRWQAVAAAPRMRNVCLSNCCCRWAAWIEYRADRPC